MKPRYVFAAVVLLAATTGCSGGNKPAATSPSPPTEKNGTVTAEHMRAIAKEAYIYGFPMVDTNRVQYSYFVDSHSPEYKGDWNQVHSIARVFTPADTAIRTPNSDTPYSMLGADLRTEPLVLTIPPIDQDRYFAVQFFDGYTYNFAYLGSRTTGNSGGKYLLAGPGWTGEKPAGINEVLRADTDIVLAIYRTQLLNPDDLENVRNLQAGCTAQPLSAFLNQPAPAAAPPIDFPVPLSPDQQKTSPRFFNLLNFALRFAPVLPSEKELRDTFATIGIGSDGTFDYGSLSPEKQKAMTDGMANAWTELNTFRKDKLDTGQVTSGDLFGTEEELKGNYLYRMAGAVLGIYGNSKAEAMYPVYATDADGQPLTGADNYTLTFPAGQLPPVNAFWSLTMYKLPESLLVENPINRYLINSPMLPDLARNPDGSLTLYLQNSSPGPEKAANWLPAPPGPFTAVLRLYWPKPDAINGSWQAPKLLKA